MVMCWNCLLFYDEKERMQHIKENKSLVVQTVIKMEIQFDPLEVSLHTDMILAMFSVTPRITQNLNMAIIK